MNESDMGPEDEEDVVPSLTVWIAAVFIILFGSILVCGGLFFIVREIAGSGSMQETKRTSQQLSIIRQGVRKYHFKNGTWPPAGNAELTKTLLNAQNRVLNREDALKLRVQGGRLHDGWNQPYIYEAAPGKLDGSMILYSPGANGRNENGQGDDPRVIFGP